MVLAQIKNGQKDFFLNSGGTIKYDTTDNYIYCLRAGIWVRWKMADLNALDGKTVTPVADAVTWQKCAGIASPTYTTLADILADSEVLTTVMSVDNAVDYLVRSTSWTSAICGNQNAMQTIGANDYTANTLLKDSAWFSAITSSSYYESVLNKSVPTMTSATTPSGEVFASSQISGSYPAYNAFRDAGDWCVSVEGVAYIGYTFTEDVNIYHVYMQNRNDGHNPKSCKLQYKDINNTWQDVPNSTFTGVNTPLGTVTKNVYQREPVTAVSWRLYISSGYDSPMAPSLHRVQFYGRAVN